MTYIGRFAPSPTGALHFGSLLAAVCSYIDAKHHNGKWHLRIDDLDQPRVVAGSAKTIIHSLRAHGLQWDGDIVYQSQRSQHYRHALAQLMQYCGCYRCYCSRAQLGNDTYSGLCRHTPPPQPNTAYALRLPCPNQAIVFHDTWAGTYHEDIAHKHGDFVIWRKDDICAYQLAVVVDDIALGVTHVIRGNDLLDSTARQIYLYQCLGHTPPQYGHFPILENELGQKLSKQNHALAIDNHHAPANLRRILQCLGQAAPPHTCTEPNELLQFAIEHWQPKLLPSDNIVWPQ